MSHGRKVNKCVFNRVEVTGQNKKAESDTFGLWLC